MLSVLTALHCTCIKQGASLSTPDNDGLTPLMNAAEIGNEDLLQYLIDHGAEVNERSTSGFTPLILAAAGGHLGCVKALVHCGAKVCTTTAASV
jgi:uncharacterized protein